MTILRRIFRVVQEWLPWALRGLAGAVVVGAVVSLTDAWLAELFLWSCWLLGGFLALPVRPLFRVVWCKRRSGLSWREASAAVRIQRDFKRLCWSAGLSVREDEHKVLLEQLRASSGQRAVAQDDSGAGLFDWLTVVLGFLRWSDTIKYFDSPRILKRQVTRHGLVLTVLRGERAKTSVDLAADDVLRRLEQAAREITGFHQLMLSARVIGAKTVWRFVFRDALSAPTPIPAVDFSRRVDPEQPVVIGVKESGESFSLQVAGRQTLLVGASGAGKGSVLWALLLGVAPGIRSGLVRLHGVDLKGGVEFSLGAGFFHELAYTYEDAKKMIRQLSDGLDDRLDFMRESGVRKHVPTLEEPLELLIIDEAASLTYLAPDTKSAKEVDAALKRVLSTGRAAGVSVVAALQDPRKEALATRDLFTQIVALRLRSQDDAKLALGSALHEAGARCEQIATSMPGTGFSIDAETAEIQRFRAYWVSDEAVREMAARVQGGVERV
ncbi:type IV secretory system conjugative DNA transfer family protein [Glutamicibacter ardleyensis]|uniref:type IV secretory system conjugative DNA transfer family protein n=1 Tax=Glutamicibacter ardleyensis TaxID=225894 RepID=UPI003FCF7A37